MKPFTFRRLLLLHRISPTVLGTKDGRLCTCELPFLWFEEKLYTHLAMHWLQVSLLHYTHAIVLQGDILATRFGDTHQRVLQVSL
jgi:hypothetical protein